jgi:NAD(P)H-hydrate epimerase
VAGETFPALPPRPFDANKSTMGSVTVVGASTGLSGAAILAAHAAIRSGCGRVTIAVPATVANVAEEQKPLEVMCWSPLDGESCWTATAIDSLLQSPHPDCWVFGCGLGRDRRSTAALASWLKARSSPAVIDADGLWHLGEDPTLIGKLGQDTILTPHEGELNRLAQVFDLKGLRREDLGTTLHQRSGSVVVAKGPDTVTIGPSGVHPNRTGNPGMATAGSGDVLAGVIGALVARGDPPETAARRGVWLHGYAGDLAAGHRGQESMIAGDIIEMLGEAFQKLEECR